MNRFAHKHAMAEVNFEEPQSKAGAACSRALALVNVGCKRPSLVHAAACPRMIQSGADLRTGDAEKIKSEI